MNLFHGSTRRTPNQEKQLKTHFNNLNWILGHNFEIGGIKDFQIDKTLLVLLVLAK